MRLFGSRISSETHKKFLIVLGVGRAGPNIIYFIHSFRIVSWTNGDDTNSRQLCLNSPSQCTLSVKDIYGGWNSPCDAGKKWVTKLVADFRILYLARWTICICRAKYIFIDATKKKKPQSYSSIFISLHWRQWSFGEWTANILRTQRSTANAESMQRCVSFVIVVGAGAVLLNTGRFAFRRVIKCLMWIRRTILDVA